MAAAEDIQNNFWNKNFLSILRVIDLQEFYI